MELDLADLESSARLYELAVDSTEGIDPWCSGPDWTLPVLEGFAPGAKPLLLSTDGGYAVLATHQTEDGGQMIAGFEPLWGFACPIVGPDPEQVATAVADRLGSETNWGRLVLPGLPDDLRLARTLAGPLSRLGELGGLTGIVRQIADLDDFERWFGRRSRSFRRNLRTAGRRAEARGLGIEDAADDPNLFTRLLGIERHSWKGRADNGITTEPMNRFYAAMTSRLQRNGRCRCLVATIDGVDAGFILGGVRAGRYRGLQLSYVEEFSSLSVSHLLQLEQIRRLCDEGVTTYDLGMEMAYKASWADRIQPSIALIVERS